LSTTRRSATAVSDAASSSASAAFDRSKGRERGAGRRKALRNAARQAVGTPRLRHLPHEGAGRLPIARQGQLVGATRARREGRQRRRLRPAARVRRHSQRKRLDVAAGAGEELAVTGREELPLV
jgi:hypothetical protein